MLTWITRKIGRLALRLGLIARDEHNLNALYGERK